jgi:hypothetical protein
MRPLVPTSQVIAVGRPSFETEQLSLVQNSDIAVAFRCHCSISARVKARWNPSLDFRLISQLSPAPERGFLLEPLVALECCYFKFGAVPPDDPPLARRT